MQMRAARYVIDPVILVQGYCDGLGKFARIGFAPVYLGIVRWYYQPRRRKQCESQWYRRRCGQRPSQEGAARSIPTLSKFLIQALMKTIWRSQHTLIAVKNNHIAHSIEERSAMTALSKMLIQRGLLKGIELLVDII
jgi:hypothetical protein